MEMDPIARKCIAACWPLVIGVIARVRGMLGEAAGHPDSLVPRPVYFRALRLVRVAEAMVRRMLYLISTEIEVSCTLRPLKDGPAPEKSATPGPGPGSGEPRPVPVGWLQIAEPLLNRFPAEPRPVYGPAPSIWLWGTPRPPEPPGPPEAFAPDTLERRLARLEASCAAPEEAARRLALWQARQQAEFRDGRGARRMHPLRIGRPPGFARRGMEPELKRRLKDLWYFCEWADNAPRPQPQPPPGSG